MFLIGHILFFSSLIILNNSLLFIEAEIRFALFSISISLGALLILSFGDKKRYFPIFRYIFLIIIFLFSLIRINSVGSIEGDSTSLQVIQSILVISVLISSIVISSRFDIRISKIVIIISGFVFFIPVFINRNFIFSYELKNNFTLGVLTYDSYQIISQIIGMMIICTLSYEIERRKFDVRALFSSALILAGLFTMTLSPARGESIALVLAMSTYFITGGRWLILIIATIVLINFGGLLSDSVLFERLSGVTEGDFGARDQLFSLAFDQIFSNAYTFLLGGGFNYFQHYNFLPLELYPHNFLLEGFISGGLPLFIVLVVVFILPIPIALRQTSSKPEARFLLCFMIYLVLIYSKSGTLSSMWGLSIYACFFVAAISLRQARQSKID